MTITPSYVATQARSGLSNTLNFPERKHPVSLRPSAYLKLCDSSVADLSSRGCIFTSIESFHFVVQLPDKVYLQRAGAWGGVHRERVALFIQPRPNGENLLFFNNNDDGIMFQKQGQPTAGPSEVPSYLSVER